MHMSVMIQQPRKRSTHHLHRFIVLGVFLEKIVVVCEFLVVISRVHYSLSFSPLLLHQLSAARIFLVLQPALFFNLGQNLVLEREEVWNSRVLLGLGAPLRVLVCLAPVQLW